MSTITDNNPYVEEMLRIMNMSPLDVQVKIDACTEYYQYVKDNHGLKVAEEAWFDAYKIFKSERQKEVSNV